MNKQKKQWKRILKNNMYMLKFFTKVCPSLILFMFLSTVLQAINTFLLNTYLYQYALNALQNGSSLKSVLITLTFMIIFSTFNRIFQNINNCYFNLKYPKVEEYIHNLLHKKASEVELACFENSEFYDTYVKATNEASNRAYSVVMNIMDFIWAAVNVAAGATLIATIDPLFLGIAFAPLICTLIVGKKQNKQRYERDSKNSELARQRDYVQRTFYLKDFSKEQRLTNISQVLFKRMRSSISEMKMVVNKHGYKLMFFRYLFDFVFDVIVEAGSKLLAAYKTLVSKTMLLGDCFVVINSISSLAGNFNYIGNIIYRLDEHSLYIDNLRQFLDYEIKIADDPTMPLASKFTTLQLHNMSFKYDEQGSNVLNKINLSIRSGEKIAIVGHNGAGKTTLVKLLLRLYDCTEGEILLNGQNIKNYRLSSYRNLFGTVFQDYLLFAVTVAENVMLKGNLSTQEKDKVNEAIKKAGIQEKIATLTNGIDSVVTKEFDEQGAVFSGGEAQKLSIARIFAANNEIVIMDEPTSALDPIAEQEMYKNMFDACKGKTVIFISHRLSSAAMADRIYLFENGEIAEQGTHSELISLNSKYADMWHKQADAYTEKQEVKL